MKNLKKLALALVALFAVPGLVNAAELPVDDEGDLDACLAIDGNTCILDTGFEVNSTITISVGQNVVIDLNGNNITSDLSTLFHVTNGTLTITGNGTITNTGDVLFVEGNTTLGGAKRDAVVVIESGVTIVSKTSNCIYIRGNGAKADIYGDLVSESTGYAAVQGNGTVSTATNTDNGHTEINIYDGASVINETNHAIYHPQSGTLTVYGGTIKGITGIEMRSGDLVVEDGEITSLGTTTTSAPNGNGTAVDGAAIAVAQHTTIQEVSITINGGVITGPTAVYEETPENPSDETIVNLEIAGGEFISTNDTQDAISSENKTGFITGDITADVASVKYAKDGAYITLNESLDVDDVLAVPDGVSVELPEEDFGEKVFVDNGDGTFTVKESADLTKLIELIEKIEKLDEKDYTEKSAEEFGKLLDELGEELENLELTVDNQDKVDDIVKRLEAGMDKLIKKNSNPETSDNIGLYFSLALVSLTLAGAVVLKKRYN